ncbi:MAG: hypothetical protein ABIH83_00465 [Candidatus Micrarchaeota archaeon]
MLQNVRLSHHNGGGGSSSQNPFKGEQLIQEIGVKGLHNAFKELLKLRSSDYLKLKEKTKNLVHPFFYDAKDITQFSKEIHNYINEENFGNCANSFLSIAICECFDRRTLHGDFSLYILGLSIPEPISVRDDIHISLKRSPYAGKEGQGKLPY